MIGGLMKDEDVDNVTKIPVLGDIPILGWLFKSKTKTKDKTNLIVFITPKIVRNPEDGDEIFERKISQRIEFIQRSMNGRDPHGRYVDELPRRKRMSGTPAKSRATEEPVAPSLEPETPPPDIPEEPAVESF